MDLLKIIKREQLLFNEDLERNKQELDTLIQNSSFLVIGAAGTIGQAVTREIFKRSPKRLHAVDISENNLVELVRTIRSSLGYISGEFKTFAIDYGSTIFRDFFEAHKPYDFVLNLSALKHVRSEKDVYTLRRLIQVNVLNALDSLELAANSGARKYFCVSTDKAANPVNLMGASKRLMEIFLFDVNSTTAVSTARFPNVAFSDGSLLHGFNQRFLNQQPIPAPSDVKRYFVVPEEAGQLCLLSCLLGQHHEIFFPKLKEELHMITFKEVAENYLHARGYVPYPCASEDEARTRAPELIAQQKWPCYFFESDTSGEKGFEEFFMEHESLDWQRFHSLGVIQNSFASFEHAQVFKLKEELRELVSKAGASKAEFIEFFQRALGEFSHLETGKYLDDKM